MIIKLKCNKCKYSFSITEKELLEHLDMYKPCFLQCGGKNEVENLDQIVMLDIKAKVKSNITKWFAQYGCDYVIDLCKRYKDYYNIGKLYIEELQARGINIKT